MDWLNYHHLLYFWTVARTGSIVAASEELMLAQPTISAQIRKLEQSLGEELFHRTGRSLVLTDVGQQVFGYADEIFSLGRELMQTVKQHPTGRPSRVSIGVTPAVPRLAAWEIMRPIFEKSHSDAPPHVTCRTGSTEDLIAELATHRLDVVITDEPAPASVSVKAYNHKLGSCGITFFATPDLADQMLKNANFPKCLDAAPLLLPATTTHLRQTLDKFFENQRIRPAILAEFDDLGLLKATAQHAVGAFAIHSPVADEVARQYHVQPLGSIERHTETFYAITVERRLKHPLVAKLTETARNELFTPPTTD